MTWDPKAFEDVAKASERAFVQAQALYLKLVEEGDAVRPDEIRAALFSLRQAVELAEFAAAWAEG